MSETSSNPNVPVQSDGPIKANGSNPVFFEDMENAPDPGTKPAKPKAEKAEPKARPKSVAKDRKEAEDVTDGEEGEPKKGKPKDAKDDAAADEKDSKDEKAERKAKPKVHKIKSGDDLVDLSGDSIVTATVDGKKQEVPLQDLIDNWSGEKFHHGKLTELDKREKAFEKNMGETNSRITEIYQASQKDPSIALDLLADFSGKDPVEMKEQMLRAQIAEALPYAMLDEAEREEAIKDKVRDWRDARYARSKETEQKTKAEQQRQQQVEQVRSKYGIDEKSYSDAESMVRKFFEQSGDKKEPTVADVIYADRYVLTQDTIAETVPHLASHAQFDRIVHDVTQTLVDSPNLGKEKLRALLLETWGEDDGLKKLGRKAKARAEDTGETFQKPKASRKEAVFFDDLD